MKHKSLYLILCTLLCCVSCGKSSYKRVSVPTDPNAKVWVCTGESSERYHAFSLDEEVVVKDGARHKGITRREFQNTNDQ
jgi:hypothetical protein